MVVLPDKRALGGLSTAAPRQQSINVPVEGGRNQAATARALSSISRTAGNFAVGIEKKQNAANVAQAKVNREFDRERKYAAQSAWAKFRAESEKSLLTSQSEFDYGDTDGKFIETFAEDFEKKAGQFMSDLPPDLQAEYDAKMLSLGTGLRRNTEKFYKGHKRRWFDNDQAETQADIIERGRLDPDGVDDYINEGKSLIDNLPDDVYDSVDRDERKREFERSARLNIFQDRIDKDPEFAKGLVGVSDTYADKIIGVESNGRADAKNPNSSATGAGQFIKSTWAAFIKERHPELMGKGDIQKLRNDFNLSKEAVQWYGAKNASKLRQSGLPVNDATVYLSHFAGSDGAKKLLQNPGESARALLGDAVIRANPFLKGKSGADVVKWAAKKMGMTMDGLTGGDITKMERLAQRKIDETERAEEAEINNAETETRKDGYRRAFDNELTPEWVEENRDLLTVSDYKTLLRATGEDKSSRKTEPQEFLQLMDLVDSDPATAKNTVRQLYADDQIAKADFLRIYQRADKRLSDNPAEKFDSDFSGYVKRVMSPGRDAPKSHYSRQLDAVFAFEDWVEQNPKASRADMRERADEIITDYRKIRYGTGETKMPRPEFLRKQNFTADDLKSAMTQTRDKYKAGKYTKREAAEQAALLRQWGYFADD